MSDTYQPDFEINNIDSIKLLSQRDLAIHVPVNFVPAAGVNVAAACTVANTYETSAYAKCISNLLTAGFRRFTLDLYWDETRGDWSFCPVQLGNSDEPVSSITAETASRRSAVTGLLSTTLGAAAARWNDAPTALELRQATSTQQASRTLATSVPASATHSSTQADSATTSVARSTTAATTVITDSLVTVGLYKCSPATDYTLFLNILGDYLDLTQNNLNATTIYLYLNVNAAASTDPSVAVPPNNLPADAKTLSALLLFNTTNYLYTPENLQQQRANLNASGGWFTVPQNVAPDPAYFDLIDHSDTYSTPNGWPSESFIEFERIKRLVVGFGQVSASMSRYNLSADTQAIFAPGFNQQARQHEVDSAGNIVNGCFFNPVQTQLASVNNSWAVAGVQGSNVNMIATNFTNCGYGPVLNQTISNLTAAQSPDLYHQFVMSTIWSWSVDQPRISTDSDSDYRCAVLNSTSGTWQADSCSANHFCACRVNGGPYNWQISSSELPYDRAQRACPDDSTFTVSRTALENDYLLDKWRSVRSSSSISDELLWVNFNDLDVPNCWVVGQNATCPYKQSDNSASRIVTVPTVAAVIVFVLTILTVFVKCAANRQNSKRRRRRGDDGHGDYEGVPA